MATAVDNDDENTPWTELLPRLQSLASSRDYAGCASVSRRLLDDPALPEDVRPVVSTVHARSLLRTDALRAASEFCERGGVDGALRVEEAYASYRARRYRVALGAAAAAAERDPLGGALVAAQCCYRLSRTREAMEHYERAAASAGASSVDAQERVANVSACAQAVHDPWADDAEATRERLEAAFREADDGDHDLAYNHGTWCLVSAASRARRARAASTLRRALAAAERVDDPERETAPVAANLAVAAWETGRDDEGDACAERLTRRDDKLPPSVRAVAEHNAALRATEPPTSLPPAHESLSPAAARAVSHNRAVCALRSGKEARCRDAIKEVERGQPATANHKTDAGGGKKQTRKGGSSAVVDRAAARLRARLLEAETLRTVKSDKEGARALLEKLLANDKDLASRPTARTEFELTLAQYDLIDGNVDAARSYLEKAYRDPASPLHRKPAVAATLLSMTTDRDNTNNATASDDLLTSLDDDAATKASLGEYYVREGRWQEAVDVFADLADRPRSNDGDDEDDRAATNLALHVVALSHVDVDAAEEKAADLVAAIDHDDDDDDEPVLDPEELETRPVPWSSSSHGGSGGNKLSRQLQRQQRQEHARRSHQKSREAVSRARARRREAYLREKNLPDTRRPDPERWIPKRHRKGVGRRRNRLQGRSNRGQGAAGVEDARLDVRARGTAADARDGAPSTRHMSVSSGGGNLKKKGGRKR